MDALDLDVRRHVYFSIVANGQPPTAAMAPADPGLRPRSTAASQGTLDGLDLRGEFWALQ